MGTIDIKDQDFTDAAWESFYEAVDDTQFLNSDAQLIYASLRKSLRIIPFGDYLKRYIFHKAGLSGSFRDIPVKEYQLIIKYAFADNHTPPSFSPTTAKLSALSKNWLTQKTVKRNVVFLLGFGLGMSVDDVNMFLTKALQEHEINPKSPFEVICWYCYKHGYNFLKYEKLWEEYMNAPTNLYGMGLLYGEHTVGVWNTMHGLHNDAALMAHISKLKTDDNISRMSVTARECFTGLYDKARDRIADIYNQNEQEENFDRNDCAKKRKYTRQDITESDMERIICAAIPKDRHGNLTPSKASKLSEQFAGKRFSRQRIGEILANKTEINRFDLITLHFFICSQMLDDYPNATGRYAHFLTTANEMLERCYMGKIHVQNPYECFILMCILSEDPLGTYADVWELSYDE